MTSDKTQSTATPGPQQCPRCRSDKTTRLSQEELVERWRCDDCRNQWLVSRSGG